MGTAVTLDDDPTSEPYRHHPSDIGLKIDVSNVAEVLELLDER